MYGFNQETVKKSNIHTQTNLFGCQQATGKGKAEGLVSFPPRKSNEGIW